MTKALRSSSDTPARRGFIRRLPMFCLGGASLFWSTSGVWAAEPQASTLTFIDLPKFDRELTQQLGTSQQKVVVNFYEPVSPNRLPERLQRWIAAVEKAGGAVNVDPPPDEPVPKGPLALLGLLGSLLSSLKTIEQMVDERSLLKVADRNVRIALQRDGNRQVIVSSVVFMPRGQ